MGIFDYFLAGAKRAKAEASGKPEGEIRYDQLKEMIPNKGITDVTIKKDFMAFIATDHTAWQEKRLLDAIQQHRPGALALIEAALRR